MQNPSLQRQAQYLLCIEWHVQEVLTAHRTVLVGTPAARGFGYLYLAGRRGWKHETMTITVKMCGESSARGSPAVSSM